MAGYVNTSAPISERALQIARDSLPAEYRGEYLFYRDSVPRTGMSESYTIVLCDTLVTSETGYICIDRDTQCSFVFFGFYDVPENAPEGSEGVCWWHLSVPDGSGHSTWPVQSHAGTLVYGSSLGLPRLKEIGGDRYAFAILVFLCIAFVYGCVWNAWNQLHR